MSENTDNFEKFYEILNPTDTQVKKLEKKFLNNEDIAQYELEIGIHQKNANHEGEVLNLR